MPNTVRSVNGGKAKFMNKNKLQNSCSLVGGEGQNQQGRKAREGVENKAVRFKNHPYQEEAGVRINEKGGGRGPETGTESRTLLGISGNA